MIEALGILVASGYITLNVGSRGAKEYAFAQPYKNGDPITVLDGAAAGHDGGAPAECTEHPWHEGQWCNPDWCHVGHHGRCNRLAPVGGGS